MVSELKTFTNKGWKIAAQRTTQKNLFFFGEFCLTSKILLVSVQLSASVERCFVSRIRDFFGKYENRLSLLSCLVILQISNCFNVESFENKYFLRDSYCPKYRFGKFFCLNLRMIFFFSLENMLRRVKVVSLVLFLQSSRIMCWGNELRKGIYVFSS